MADIRISDLPTAPAANGTMQLEVNDSGTSRKVTAAQLGTYIRTGGGTPTPGFLVETGSGPASRTLQPGLGVGITNPTGAAGDPTFSVTRSTQEQAEAGTDNESFMTPLRTAQAIAELGGGTGTSGGWAEVGAEPLYDFAEDGSTQYITSPEFEDGFEYMFLFERLRSTRTALKRIDVQFQNAAEAWLPRIPLIEALFIPTQQNTGRDDDNIGVYNSLNQGGVNMLQPAGNYATARVLMPNPRLSSYYHAARAEDVIIGGFASIFGPGVPNPLNTFPRQAVTTPVAPAILENNAPFVVRRVRFTWATAQSPTGGGLFNQGTVRMMRRGFVTV